MVKSISNKWKPLIITIVAILLLVCSFIVVQQFRKKSIALRAVNDMYSFVSYDSLASNNMPDLEKVCTSEIYNQLTVKNVDRALSTYLKFKGEPVEVNVEKATSQYIIYSLNTKSITPTRRFIFFYDTNLFGKINSVQEDELYDFYQNNN